jgi:glycosyltransferase involved in cell wall biosynthesis
MKSEIKTLVIIHAFNEEGFVGKVVKEVKTQLPGMDALVVNDGSTDLISEIARSRGAIVLDLPYNLGIGGAMQAGYKYAYEKGYDIAIAVDMDGRMLRVIFEEGWLEVHPIKLSERASERPVSEAEKMSSEEMEIVKKRLRSLGYLD